MRWMLFVFLVGCGGGQSPAERVFEAECRFKARCDLGSDSQADCVRWRLDDAEAGDGVTVADGVDDANVGACVDAWDTKTCPDGSSWSWPSACEPILAWPPG